MKRPLLLREYQTEPAKFSLKNDISILAIAPNGGKTEISIYVISEFLKKNPKSRVLILPH